MNDIKNSVAYYNDNEIGIETIYTVVGDKQINIPEKVEWLRKLGRNNELYCSCGANLILVAGKNNLRTQHFRHKFDSDSEHCSGSTETKESRDSKIVLKCWLEDKLHSADIESRIPIYALEDTKRKYQFSFLCKSRKIALSYCRLDDNLSDEKLRILSDNSKGIRVIYVISSPDYPFNGQYPEFLMKIQKVQGYVLLLSINEDEYMKATLRAVFYEKNLDGIWEEITFAKGRLSSFFLYRDDVTYDFEPLSNRMLATRFQYSSDQKDIKRKREEEAKERERQRLAYEADLERRKEEYRKKAEEEKAAAIERAKKEQAERARIAEEERLAKIAAKKKFEEDQAIFMENLKSQLDKSDVAIKAPDGMTWIKCRICDTIGNPVDFVTEYNGENRVNPGLCKKCKEKMSSIQEPIQITKKENNTCPRCGKELITKTARTGANAGKQFLGCSGWPGCNYTRSI